MSDSEMPDDSPASTDIVHRLESPCGRIAVEYRWQGDRFVHRILMDNQVCLSSVDGDGSQAWPASPPIQQISLEPIQDVPMILGVGGAGRGHWSISVGWQAAENQNDDDPKSGEFRFDIACRVKDSPDFLGSTYASTTGQSHALDISVHLGKRTQSDQEVSISAALDGGSETYRWVYSLSAFTGS